MTFYFHGADRSRNSLFPGEARAGATRVRCTTLDAVLPAGDPVHVIKMDVEGAEPTALEGMTQTLARSPGLTLFAEYNPRTLRAAGTEPGALLERLMSLDLRVCMIDEGARRLVPVTSGLETEGRVNLYCSRRGSHS